MKAANVTSSDVIVHKYESLCRYWNGLPGQVLLVVTFVISFSGMIEGCDEFESSAGIGRGNTRQRIGKVYHWFSEMAGMFWYLDHEMDMLLERTEHIRYHMEVIHDLAHDNIGDLDGSEDGDEGAVDE